MYLTITIDDVSAIKGMYFVKSEKSLTGNNVHNNMIHISAYNELLQKFIVTNFIDGLNHKYDYEKFVEYFNKMRFRLATVDEIKWYYEILLKRSNVF